MKPRTALITVILSFFFLQFLVYLLRIGGENHVYLTNILYFFAPLLAVAGGTYAVNVYQQSNPHGKSLMYLTGGVFAWLMGELIWAVLEFFLHIDSYPSVADFFYIGGYFLIFAGLVNEIKMAKLNWKSLQKPQWMVTGLGLAVFSILILYFLVFQSFDPEVTAGENIVSILYGVGDLFVVIPCFFVLKLVMEIRGGSFFKSWLAIFLALFSMLTGDLIYAFVQESYDLFIWPYTVIDLFWSASYFFFAYGFFTIGFAIKNIHGRLTKTKAGIGVIHTT